MKKLDPKIVASAITAVAGVIATIITGVFSVVINNSLEKKYQAEISELQNQLEQYSLNSETNNEILSKGTTELTTENNDNTKLNENHQSSNSTATVNTSGKNNESSVGDFSQMIAVDWRSKSNYQSYSGSGKSTFKMFADDYKNGFTIEMDNSWDPTEYVTYNINAVSEKYSVIKMLVGHVDGYESNDVKLNIYLDRTLTEKPNYEYTISPNVAPQWINIDVTDCSALTVKVYNRGSRPNCIGFANISYE